MQFNNSAEDIKIIDKYEASRLDRISSTIKSIISVIFGLLYILLGYIVYLSFFKHDDRGMLIMVGLLCMSLLIYIIVAIRKKFTLRKVIKDLSPFVIAPVKAAIALMVVLTTSCGTAYLLHKVLHSPEDVALAGAILVMLIMILVFQSWLFVFEPIKKPDSN